MRKYALFAAVAALGLLVVAWSSVGAASAPSGPQLQTTAPPPVPPIGITVVAPTSSGPSTVTTMPPALVWGLLAIVVIAIIVIGMALVSRGQS